MTKKDPLFTITIKDLNKEFNDAFKNIRRQRKINYIYKKNIKTIIFKNTIPMLFIFLSLVLIQNFYHFPSSFYCVFFIFILYKFSSLYNLDKEHNKLYEYYKNRNKIINKIEENSVVLYQEILELYENNRVNELNEDFVNHVVYFYRKEKRKELNKEDLLDSFNIEYEQLKNENVIENE